MPLNYRFKLYAFLIAVLISGAFMLSGCGQDESPLSHDEDAAAESPLVSEEEEEAALPEEQPESDDPDNDLPGDQEQKTGNEAESSPPSGNDLPADQQNLPVIANGDYLLALVTKETTLKSNYAPADLEPIPAYMFPSRDMQLRREALEHLEELWSVAEEEGVILTILSAYRSYSYQMSLFNRYAEKHGEEQANRFSARPGQSEHQLGTAVDFGGTAFDFKAEFAQTPQGRWLAENAYRFGFALSYPEGKEHITGYIFEPWHYRYIGLDYAYQWKAAGITLKEFLEAKPQYYE